MNPNRPTIRHTIKMANVKDRILKAAREKEKVSYVWNPIRLLADFSSESLNRWWSEKDYKVLKVKKLQARILYLVRLSFRTGERNNFLSKNKNLPSPPPPPKL